MIENFEYSGLFDPSVVVLDFDMSWHKGSNEKDVVFEARDDFGYLAPEQTNYSKGVSAVNTRVDSYGLGMTTFFIFGEVPPRPNEGLSEQWPDLALRAVRSGYDGNWISAPARLARVITNLTTIQQPDRMDFSLAFNELRNLQLAVLSPEKMENPELWAEEVLARFHAIRPYTWDHNSSTGKISTGRGFDVSSTCDLRLSKINLRYAFLGTGTSDFSRLKQMIAAIPNRVPGIIKNTDWELNSVQNRHDQVEVKMSIDIDLLKNKKSDNFEPATEVYKLFENLVT